MIFVYLSCNFDSNSSNIITKNFGQKFNIGIKKLNLMQIHIDEKLNKSHAEKIKEKGVFDLHYCAQ
jgi:hypothetical protein